MLSTIQRRLREWNPHRPRPRLPAITSHQIMADVAEGYSNIPRRVVPSVRHRAMLLLDQATPVLMVLFQKTVI